MHKLKRTFAFLARTLDRPWLRVAMVACTAAGLMCVLLMQRASAEVSELALDVGHELSAFSDTLLSNNQLRFNGQKVDVANLRTAQSLDALFTRFAASCRDAEFRPEELTSQGKTSANVSTDARSLGVFAFRPRADEGVMFCFGGANDFRAIARGARAFAQSGDLAAIGQVRYLYARQQSDRVIGLLVRSHGAFNVRTMFGPGDVPGADITSGVRPAASTRAISLSAGEYAMTSYRTNTPLREAVASYEHSLRSAGFDVRGLPGAAASPSPDDAVRMALNARDAFIISGHRDDEETIISAVRVGARDHLRTQ